MQAVIDRIVQYPNRYQLTNVETQEVLGTFDFDEVTGTVQQVGTEIDAELFQSIADDLAARVVSAGGELSGTIVTFSDISGTAENVASGDTSATLWGKVKNWFSRLKALAFKNKVAAGDFEAGAIKNADVAADAAIAQSKVSGLMTDYVASMSVSGRTVTYKNKNGVDMGSITTQDTTYGLASQSINGLMSSTDKTKLDGIESGAQKNTVLGVKGSSESAYRTGNVNITKANIGLGNVDNTSDEDKPVSTAMQTALNGKANTSGSYPNLTVGKATNAANATKATQDGNGNVITEMYATKNELNSGLSGKANTSGTYPNLTVGTATNAENANTATNAQQAQQAQKVVGSYEQLEDGTYNLIIRLTGDAPNNAAITQINGEDLAGKEFYDYVRTEGAVLFSFNPDFSPAARYGGSWEKITNRFLVGAGRRYTLGSTGGNAEHLHGLSNAIAGIVLYNDRLNYANRNSPAGWTATRTYGIIQTEEVSFGGLEIGAPLIGNTETSNNIPPYIACNIWHKVA